MEHSYLENQFVCAVELLLIKNAKWHKKRIVWAGDYANNEPGKETNIAGILEDKKKIRPKCNEASIMLLKYFRYIVNHTLKQYVDKNEVIKNTRRSDSFYIHPLPLLTCEGNGGGGGDFRGEDDRIGMWARHRISIENKKPPKSYTEIDGLFEESN